MTDSRAKGARGERDAAKEWAKATGLKSRRGQQFSGSPDSPDVATEADIHLEVKRCERGNPYDWVDQACGDCGEKLPVVLHRRNNRPWLVIVRLTDVARLATTLAPQAEAVGDEQVPADVSRQDLPADAKANGRQLGDVSVRSGGGVWDHLPAEYPG